MFGNKKNEILVYVKGDPYDYIVRKELDISSDGSKVQVTMTRATPDREAWIVECKGCVRYNKFKKAYIEVIQGHSHALKLDMEQKDWTITTLTPDEQKKIINLKIFRAHYANFLADLVSAIKPYLFGLLGLTIVAIVIGGVSAYFGYQAQNYVLNYYLVK
jgi:hypothetical protein